MTVCFIDPRAETATEPEPYELSIDVRDRPLTIGLLANGFPDSVVFLEQVASALASSLPDATFRHYDKGDASSIASEEMLATIVAECGAVVAAYGH